MRENPSEAEDLQASDPEGFISAEEVGSSSY